MMSLDGVDNEGPTRSIDDEVKTARKHIIESGIVRVMKARKQLPHLTLISEVLHQINAFVPQMKQIKQCIESLIEREYLERDSELANTYKYLA